MSFHKLILVLGAWVCGLPAYGQILVGQTAGFTGVAALSVKETAEGAKLYLDAVNARGGVNGQSITIVAMDDKFDPKLAADNARELVVNKNVVALFLTRGTPHNEAILPILDEHRVPLIAPSTGAMVLHNPIKRYVFNVRSTYQIEAEKAVAHLVQSGVTRIAVLHANDSFGADALEGAQRGFEKAKAKPIFVEKMDRSKPDYTQVAPLAAKVAAQAVVILGSGSTVIDGVKALRAAGSSAQVVTLSNNASSGFAKALGEFSRGVVVTQVFPSERSTANAMVKEAIEAAKAKGVDDVSPAMLEGFAAAKVLVEALRRSGKSITRQTLHASLEAMDKFDLGGLVVGYSPTDHTGLSFTDISVVGADGKFRR